MAIKIKSCYSVICIMICLLISCAKKNDNADEEKTMHNLFFNNEIIKNKLFELFEINKEAQPKVFKVLVARHGNFVRVTIFQVFYNSEIEKLPAGTFSYNRNLFLYYNGSEMLFDKHVKQGELDRQIKVSEIKLRDTVDSILDTKVLQFQINNRGEISINHPAINPFDEQINSVKFK